MQTEWAAMGFAGQDVAAPESMISARQPWRASRSAGVPARRAPSLRARTELSDATAGRRATMRKGSGRASELHGVREASGARGYAAELRASRAP